MQQVHYFGGWVDGAKSLWCPDFADRQTYKKERKNLKSFEKVLVGKKIKKRGNVEKNRSCVDMDRLQPVRTLYPILRFTVQALTPPTPN